MSLSSKNYFKKLDFDLIKNKISELSSFYISKQLALSFNPCINFKEVKQLQLETFQCRQLLNNKNYINCSDIDDSLSSILSRVEKNGILSSLEIGVVKKILNIQLDFKNLFINQKNKFPLLENMAKQVPCLEPIIDKINEFVGDNGFILDTPNNNLNNIRSKVANSYEKVIHNLESIIESSIGKEVVQDPIILVRGDRLVLSIKSGMGYKLPGILHGSSNSGSTQFIEPFGSVGNCNNWRESLEEEDREIKRILSDLSNLIYNNLDKIKLGISVIGEYDFIQARALYSENISGIIVETIEDWNNPSARENDLLKIIDAKHPLLKNEIIPLNIHLKKDTPVLLISGPNAGGKTIALKTIGILVLMNQYGINIPVKQGSILPFFKNVLVDLGDDQGIESSVSTYSSHLESISRIFKQAKPDSLVLLDEIGSNTDPEEGAALAKAILKNFSTANMLTIATTHHRTVMIYAESDQRIINASVQFDELTFKPTYELKQGQMGQSNAIDLAIQKGFPPNVINNAKEFLNSQDEDVKEYFRELVELKESYEKDLSKISKENKKISLIKDEINEQIKYLISNKNQMLNSIRTELLGRRKKALKKIKDLESGLKKISEKGKGIDLDVKKSINEIKTDISKQGLDNFQPEININKDNIKIGDNVILDGFNLEGNITTDVDQNGEVDIDINGVRIRVNVLRLKKISNKNTFSSSVNFHFTEKLQDNILDIRGQRVESALVEVSSFLDLAVRDGFEFVKVIHGGGSGALKNAVREESLKNSLVKSIEPNLDHFNADIATIIHLK